MSRTSANLDRRAFLAAMAASTAALSPSFAAADPLASDATAFVPLSMPGKIAKVTKANAFQANGLWPTEEAAKAMLERAMFELTGKRDLGEAFAKFVHKDDKVAIKPNGIAKANMATNKELVFEIVRGVMAAGVPASNITIYEQYPKMMIGTRIWKAKDEPDAGVPAGVTTSVHENKDATMSEIVVAGKKTKFVRAFTEATAVINVGLIKDHNICGFTGCLKNVTHGSTINPHDFHEHHASPQIAELYAQSVVKSRVRLHIVDGLKMIYDQGPLDLNPARRVVHGAIYATTDPVAMDVLGWNEVEKLRKENGLSSLRDVGREPNYIKIAAELGLGVYDKNAVSLRTASI